MTTDRETTRIVRSWLRTDEHESADRLLDAVLDQLDSTQQRRAARRPAWRYPTMSKFAGIGIAAAAIVIAAIIGYRALIDDSGVGEPVTVGSPTPTQTPARPTPWVDPSIPNPPLVHSGRLDAGTYKTTELEGTDVVVMFTVPDGWAWNGFYLSKGAPGADGVVVSLWSGDMQVYADPCQWEDAPASPPTGPTAADLIDALASQPMRDASAAEVRNASSFNGVDIWPGRAVTLTVPDEIRFADCSRGQFRSWGPEPNERYHQGIGQRDYVWAIDVAGYRVVVDSASMPGMPDGLLAEADAIMASIVMWDTH